MPGTVSNAVNCGLSWFIVALALLGYVITIRRTGERWMFWIILACGWGLFAVAQTVVLIGDIDNASFISALWISSFVLVLCSLVLVFLKLIRNRHQTEGQK